MSQGDIDVQIRMVSGEELLRVRVDRRRYEEKDDWLLFTPTEARAFASKLEAGADEAEFGGPPA